MSKIEVFFLSGHKVKLDARTPFRCSDGSIFKFSYQDCGPGKTILEQTGAVINWDQVAWVRIAKEAQDGDD